MTFSQRNAKATFESLKNTVAMLLLDPQLISSDTIDKVIWARTYTELRTAISVVQAELNSMPPFADKYRLMGMLTSYERQTSQQLDELELDALGVARSTS